MTKMTADHLGRGAFIYIRQSTVDQLSGGGHTGNSAMLPH